MYGQQGMQKHNQIIAFVFLLKRCAKSEDLAQGSSIHADILRLGFLEHSVHLGSCLVSLYAKCGVLTKAKQVLYEIPIRNVVSWTALISGYAQHGHGDEALKCYDAMCNHDHISPNDVTYISILKACASIGALNKGKEIHDEIDKIGLLRKHAVLGTALVDMYAKCGALCIAEQVIMRLPIRNEVSWNALISGYAQKGCEEEALNCFHVMQNEGLVPNSVTFICILKVCGSTCSLDTGIRIHQEIMSRGLLGTNIALDNALVDMYAKCGLLDKAEEVVHDLPFQDVVSWNAIIAGYVHEGKGEAALLCLEKMKNRGIFPTEISLGSLLKACGTSAAIDKGKQIHDQIQSKGLLASNVMLGSALVDMYARCGELAQAEHVLNNLPVRDVVSWTSVITGYAQRGHGKDAVNCFKRMQCEGLAPDEITFLSVLYACCHTGLVDEGEIYFQDMSHKYGVIPDLNVQACIVDLFSRAGNFQKAMAVINKLPLSDYPPVWNALLGSCQKWGNVMLGELAFERATQLNSNNTAAYVIMINIYVAAGMHEDAARIKGMMEKKVLA